MRKVFFSIFLLCFSALCFAQPSGKAELLALLKGKKFSDLEKKLAYYAQTAKTNEDGRSNLTAALSDLTDDTSLLPLFDEWTAKSPDSYAAYLARGQLYVSYAWEARGSGWAKDVAEDKLREFQSRMRQAKLDFVKALEFNPQAPDAYAGLILVSYASGRGWQEAEKYFEKAIAVDPKHFQSHANMLFAYMDKWGGSHDKMFEFARAAVSRCLDAPVFGELFGLAHEEMADRSDDRFEYFSDPKVWDELNGVYKKIVAKFPASRRNHERFSEFIYLCGKFDDNILAPEYSGDYIWLARYKAEFKNDNAGALKASETAVELDPGNSLAYLYRGYYRDGLKDHAHALADYEKAIALGLPESDLTAWAYNSLGAIKLAKGDLAGAEADFIKGAELDPDSEQARINLGYLKIRRGDYQGGIDYYTWAIEGKDDEPEFYYYRGMAYEKIGEAQKAIDDYSAAIALDPDQVKYYVCRGQLYRQDGDLKSAGLDFISAIRHDRDDNNLKENAVILADDLANEKKDYGNALALYDAVIEAAPNHHWAYNNKAWLLCAVDSKYKNPKEAIRLALKSIAIRKMPENMDTLVHAYGESRMWIKALEIGSETLKLNPGNAVLKKYLNKIRLEVFLYYGLSVAAAFVMVMVFVRLGGQKNN